MHAGDIVTFKRARTPRRRDNNDDGDATTGGSRGRPTLTAFAVCGFGRYGPIAEWRVKAVS